MNDRTSAMDAAERGATVVITHRVHNGHQAGYEAWLNEIGPACRRSAGHIDWHIIRPVAGVTATYSVVIRFDSRENLEAWMHSDERNRLIEQVRPLLANDDDFFIRSGLDFWFTPEGAKAKVPVRWKQLLATWSAIYPLSLAMPIAIAPALRRLGFPPYRFIDAFFISGAVVLLMVYLVMPRYTKLLQRWLFD